MNLEKQLELILRALAYNEQESHLNCRKMILELKENTMEEIGKKNAKSAGRKTALSVCKKILKLGGENYAMDKKMPFINGENQVFCSSYMAIIYYKHNHLPLENGKSNFNIISIMENVRQNGGEKIQMDIAELKTKLAILKAENKANGRKNKQCLEYDFSNNNGDDKKPVVNLQYLVYALEALPNATITFSTNPLSPLYIHNDIGEGALLPLKRWKEKNRLDGLK